MKSAKRKKRQLKLIEVFFDNKKYKLINDDEENSKKCDKIIIVMDQSGGYECANVGWKQMR